MTATTAGGGSTSAQFNDAKGNYGVNWGSLFGMDQLDDRLFIAMPESAPMSQVMDSPSAMEGEPGSRRRSVLLGASRQAVCDYRWYYQYVCDA